MRFTRPAALARGDRIAVAAPASAFDRSDFDQGLAWLAERYRIRTVLPSIYEKRGYLAGDDARRRDELASAMLDPEVKAILMARGGYGSMRIVDQLPWDAFRAQPKWIVGFSDITTFHVEATRLRIASLHASHVNAVGRMSEPAREEFQRALEGKAPPLHFPSLHPIVAGDAAGVLVGGNIALLEAMASAGRLDLPEGCILALEDTNEAPYRLDRMLTSLRLGGYFAKASAIVLGEFTECPTGPDGVTSMEAMVSCLDGLGIPVYSGAPFGHGEINTALEFGIEVALRGGQLSQV
ncbi:LD-carboxypeptidase [Pendulispora brunnea]|uniref:LD-carboxypeptidase n=1 Tax=Pendulispora brunnea TaxID=2905690 RepID=A0ABZ2KM80_9BACT